MIKVVGYKVLLKMESLAERDETFKRLEKAGLAIPEHEDVKRRDAGVDRGVVVGVGEDAYTEVKAPWCKVGDTVAFAKYSGKLIEDPETKEKFIVINDDDVVAVLRSAE